MARRLNPNSTMLSSDGSREIPLETVEGSQAKVNAHESKKDNPHGVTKAQVGLGSVQNYGLATKAEAEAGSSNSKYMTPLRVKEAITKLSPPPSPSSLTLQDSGNYFDSNNVEGALQEVGYALNGVAGSLVESVNALLVN